MPERMLQTKPGLDCTLDSSLGTLDVANLERKAPDELARKVPRDKIAYVIPITKKVPKPSRLCLAPCAGGRKRQGAPLHFHGSRKQARSNKYR